MEGQYHFVGIGGIGMGALAALVLAKGGRASGSDLKENAMTGRLRGMGARVFIGHHQDNVAGADCVIYSSAVRMDNPELCAARERNIRVLRRAELLAQLMKDHIQITVTGAHGKTTTTSMIATVLSAAGLNPTVAVGGIRGADNGNALLGKSRYFVAEADESDGTFLCYSPRYPVITNIDYEHLDFYHNWDNILAAYRKFMQLTEPGGTLIACGDDVRLRGLLKETGVKALTYGVGSGADMIATGVKTILQPSYATEFECSLRGKTLGTMLIPLLGDHNVLNALATVGVGLEIGLDFFQIKEGLKTYQGVQRRFQTVGQVNGIRVVDDYGHHPTEIAATLKTAAMVKEQRLITIFQPHRYSRTKLLMDDFVRVLAGSDQLIITDIYAASETPLEGVSAEILAEKIRANGHRQVQYLKKDRILDHLLEAAKPGDMILTLGAGDIYQIGQDLIRALPGRRESRV